jgi:cytochrome b561
MNLRNDGRRFGPIAMLLHWSAAACVLFAWVLGVFGNDFPKSWEADLLFVHMSFGLVVLALLLGRLGWRMVSPSPPPLATPLDPWGSVAALALHVLIYALLLMVPLAGIVLRFTRGQSLPLFGLYELASPWVRDRTLSASVKNVHELLAHALLIFASLHALAALGHHYVLKDETLRRMLPGGGSRL